jgi:Lrp/AsnC family leucine-responsive transcriptional regulator
MDRVDRKLLTLLQLNNRRPLRALALELGIGSATCMRRLRRLEKIGVIRAHAAILDPRRLGLHVTAYVEVSLRDPSGADLSRFARRMQRCAEVIQCAEIAGETDYLVTVVTTDMQAFVNFSQRELGSDPHVRAYRSLLVLRQTKSEHVLPV